MRSIALPIVLALVLAAPMEAQSNKDRGGAAHGKNSGTVSIGFGAAAERDIRSYFQTNRLAPQSLPPGIAKKLARGKPLPPGIAKRHLPNDLQGRLPAYPGHEIIVVDRDVFLVEVATQIIVDILTRVL